MNYTRTEKMIIIIVVILIIVQFVILGIKSEKYLVDSKSSSYAKHMSFDGEYQKLDGDWVKWDDEKRVNTEKQQEINLKGRLLGDIDQTKKLYFYIQNLEVHIRINGQEVYSYATEGTYPDTYQSGGSRWDSINLTEVNESDEIEFNLISKYKYNYLGAYNEFVSSLTMGDSKGVLSKTIKENIFYFIGGILLVAVGLFVLTIAIILRSVNRRRFFPNMVLGVHLMVSGTLVFVSGFYITLIYSNPFVTMNISILSYVVILALLLVYLVYYVKEKHRIILKIEFMACMVLIALMVILQLAGIIDNFGVGFIAMYPIFIMEFVAIIVVINSLVASNEKKNRLTLISIIIYSIFMSGEILNYYFDFWPFPASMLIGLFIFLIIQGWISVRETISIVENSQKVARYEKEITDSRIAIMLSQIQPHFLYNALNTINYLCKTDPELAAEAVEKFSKYLRTNLESLNDNKLIPFKDEIKHVENYVSIEKLRFADVDMDFDFAVVDFSLPALTLQPIVENAIKHGLAMKDGGGTVTIQTKESDDFFTIIVSDDGVGFDVEETVNSMDENKHIGISNTKKRIENMTGGSIDVKSVINSGTDVIIKIPRRTQHGGLE